MISSQLVCFWKAGVQSPAFSFKFVNLQTRVIAP